jgi:hypothetical protein
MTSITNLIRGTDREYFDLFERSGANVLAIAAEESRDIAVRPVVATRSTDTDDACGPVWRQVLVVETVMVTSSR